MNFKLGIRLLAFAAALCMAACDFEDINHNPHEPTDKDLEPDYYGTGLLFMQMQNYVIPVEKNQYQALREPDRRHLRPLHGSHQRRLEAEPRDFQRVAGVAQLGFQQRPSQHLLRVVQGFAH